MCVGFHWTTPKELYESSSCFRLGTERIICTDRENKCYRRILQRLVGAELSTYPVLKPGPGGDTLFEALSLAMLGSQSQHLFLRKRLIDYMSSNRNEYSGFLGDDYSAYLRYMSTPGAAGDELALRALADFLGVPINVVTGDEVIWCLRYPPKQKRKDREICLAVAPAARFSLLKKQSIVTKAMKSIFWI